MTQYINKDVLIGKIEKLKAYLQIPNAQLEAIKVCDNVISVIDTLEVKEVDLDNELDFVKDAYYYFTSDERSSMKKVARHFFELGLKAQKRE